MEFRAPLSWEFVLSDVVGLLWVAGWSTAAWWLVNRRHDPSQRRLGRHLLVGVLALVGAIIGSLSVINYLNAPVSYELAEDAVHIKTRWRVHTVPYHVVKAVTRDRERRYGRAYSPWGYVKHHGTRLSGLFGITGTYQVPGIGWVAVYVTDRNRAVVLESGRPVILSPDDPDRFVEAVSERLRGLSPASWRSDK